MKGKSLKNAGLSALLVLTGLAVGCGMGTKPENMAADTSAHSQQLPFTDGKALVVPANTTIYVRLERPISSATAQSGQSFSAVLDEPLAVDGQTQAPAGAAVAGTVVAARESGHFNSTGYLRITLTSVVLNGKQVPIETNSMFVGGGSYKKRNLAFTGSGTGSSALLGALVGGGDAGDRAATYASGKNEVGFMAEKRLAFRLKQPLNIN